VDHKVQVAPHLFDGGEGGIHRGDILDITGQNQLGTNAFGQRQDAFAKRLALIGEGHLRPVPVQHRGNAPGDGVLVRDAHDEAALSGHEVSHGVFR
jgi:hypothetical protein